MIRSAAAAVCSSVPSGAWVLLPLGLQQQLLGVAAATAAGTDATAVRAAACKLIGSCAVLPGVLGSSGRRQQQRHAEQKQQQSEEVQTASQDKQQQHQEQQRTVLLQALAQCVSDEGVSVRLSAAWALANVCDEIKRQHDAQATIATIAITSSSSPTPGSSIQPAVMSAAVLRVLCGSAVAAAGDTEKVRAHGVRALGALLAAWMSDWGLVAESSSHSINSSSAQPGLSVAAASTESDDWGWVPAWLKAALGALQSCLAARSMKVVWNAAVAAAGGLQNRQLLSVPAVSDSVPGLLRLLVMLVRDSSNYKIKTHAASALAAPPDRAVYGEVFPDALLVLLAVLQGLHGSSSSTSSGSSIATTGSSTATATGLTPPAAAAGGVAADDGGVEGGLDEEGAFPNYRCVYLWARGVRAAECEQHVLLWLLVCVGANGSCHFFVLTWPCRCCLCAHSTSCTPLPKITTGTFLACRRSWRQVCCT